MENKMIEVSANAYEALIRCDERHRVVARMIERSPYVSIEDIKIILEIEDAERTQMGGLEDGEL